MCGRIIKTEIQNKNCRGGRIDMIICKTCNISMQPVMSFSKDKREKFCRCPKCYSETKHRKLQDEELDFGEELNKAIHKRK